MKRLLPVLLALCLLPFVATAALAHAALLDANPASGSVLDVPVPSVDLTFSEPVAPMAFRLVEPDGGTAILTGTALDTRVSIDLPALDKAGTYFVEWHVVSADGHPVAGTVALSMGAATGGEPLPALLDPAVRTGLWAATVLMFVGAFFGVGGAAFSAFLPPESRAAHGGPLVLVPLALAAIGVLASIPLHGAETVGASAASLADPAIWRATFATSYGTQAAGVGLAILLSAIGTRLQVAVAPVLALVALLVLCIAMILSGHVSTAEPRWLASAALIVHIAGFSFWIGALPTLLVALARPSAQATAVLATFSGLILYAVALIVASGLTLAYLQLGPLDPSWHSPYGIVLAAKLAVLVVLFSVAAWNRFVLTKPALAGSAGAVGQLRTLVVVEIILVLVVLGIVATWRFTPPPRVLAQVTAIERQVAAEPEADGEPVRTHLHASGLMADFEIAVGTSGGRATVELYPEDPDIDVRTVRMLLTPPVADAVPLELEASRIDGETWAVDAPQLSAGRWMVLVEVRVGDFDLVKLKGAVRVK